jgi:hypothetical protein
MKNQTIIRNQLLICCTAHNKQVRLAEWSKAPDLSSGTRESAWVRTPHLTIILKSG